MLTFLIAPSLGKKISTKKAEKLQHLLSLSFKEVRVKVAEDYLSVEEELLLGDTDLAWTPPHIGRDLSRSKIRRFLNIVRQGSAYYRAGLICRNDEVQSMREFAALRGAWVNPDSTGGYYLPKIWLSKMNINIDTDLSESKFYGSYHAVIEALLNNTADVGAVFCSAKESPVIKTTLDFFPEAKKKLTIFNFTDEHLNDAIFVSNLCSQDKKDKILHLFQDSEPSIRSQILEIFDAEGFEQAKHS